MRLKNTIFALLAISLSLLGLVLVEGTLRLAGLARDQRVAFQEVSGHEDYLAFNTAYLTRYFTHFKPEMAFNPFRKNKPEATFRVFVVGGSSTAGYPYHSYHGFPARLQARLEAAAAGHPIEVINLGANAASSYVLWDLKDALVAQQPDALILYAGHNEFYGAYGVGSSLHTLGQQQGLKRLVLRLKQSALFLLLADLMPDREVSPDNRSFFSRAIEDAEIELHGDVYEAGLVQYESNLRDVLETFQEAGIPVYAGLLASNLKDRFPLSDHPGASAAFADGDTLFAQRDTLAARAAYLRAKEEDTIRFRAPEAFNALLHGFSDEGLLTLVDVQQIAQTYSKSQIEDATFFTDHLHPQHAGYQHIADSFFAALRTHPRLLLTPLSFDTSASVIDPFERGFAHLQALSVLSTFPFDRQATRETELQFARSMLRHYEQSEAYSDRLVHRVYTTGMSVPQALDQGIRLARSQGDTLSTLLFYRALLAWEVFNEPLRDEAIAFGLQSLTYAGLTEELLFHALNQSGNRRYLEQLADYRNRQGKPEDAALLRALMEE